MKNSNIAESVYKVNLEYVILQNKTKELFFQCLEEERDATYFNYRLKELWGNLDHSFMADEIAEYETIIHQRDLELAGLKEQDIEDTSNKEILKLVPIAVVLGAESKFIKQKEKEYKNSMKVILRIKSRATEDELSQIRTETAKEEYLKQKVQRYTSQIVPYYSKETGNKIRDVELSTYTSMIHNTNLTRTVWNQTLNDAQIMDQQKFIIPYHSFSCPYCVAHQNKVLNNKQVMKLIGHIEEQEGDILHPNCKCILTFYDRNIKYRKPGYSKGELEEQYQIRQKVNSLTLQQEKIQTDIKIQNKLGNQDEVDDLAKNLRKVNQEIGELQKALPTTELRRQVVAINR